jgi:hypothetical protein
VDDFSSIDILDNQISLPLQLRTFLRSWFTPSFTLLHNLRY